MTYLVLARKWRPRSFETLVGQDHVVRALSHALSTQRLHHAWLFTGTRGVGKTTLSRILAKSLNCEEGITATPCGVCRACTEIDAGRFVDYVELDAASNRGVDEMTQLLEQAVYAPSAARFKVYMIDEVHMLTGHAFNAMLKTLEEPPAHVKFILATTDPQKIPVTVLSRCLQFNLKQMTGEAIVGHLQQVLEEEDIAFEVPALRLLAQAASGSMRDALSLTDQAIAYSAGNLTLDAVQGMLGTIDQTYLIQLLKALAQGQASEVVRIADELATRGLSYSGALADLAVLLSRIAIAQRVPGSLNDDDPLTNDLAGLATTLHPDLIQLFYSVAVHSRGELSLAPDEHAGFVMACLRMLALVPESGTGGGEEPSVEISSKLLEAAHEKAVKQPASESNNLASDQRGTAPLAKQASSSPEAESDVVIADEEPVVEALVVEPTSLDTQADPVTELQVASAPQASQDPVVATNGVAAQGDTARPESAIDDYSDVPPWEDLPVSYDDFESMASPESEDSDSQEAISGDSEIPLNLEALDELAVPALRAQDQFPASNRSTSPKLQEMTSATWPQFAASLPLTGLASELARQSEWVAAEGNTITLRVAVRTLAESPGKARLCTLLSEHFGVSVQLDVEYGATGDETAHAIEQAYRAQRQQEAEVAAPQDPFVQELVQHFGGRIKPGSIKAIISPRPA